MKKYNTDTFFANVKTKRLTTVAGAWVFYFINAILPLAFLLITAFAVLGVNLYDKLILQLPQEFQPAGELILGTAQKASGGITVLFVITMIFSGSTLLNQMLKDGEFIYGNKHRAKNGVGKRLLSIGALAVLFVFFMATAFIIAFQRRLFLVAGFNNRILIKTLLLLSVMIIGFILIVFLNLFVCPFKVKFKEVLAGSFLSLMIIVLGTLGFILYLRFFAGYNILYGSLAGIIIFLIWAYLIMLGLLLGINLNDSLIKGKKKTAK